MATNGDGISGNYDPADDGGRMLENRVARLEVSFDRFDDDITFIKSALSRLDELPTRRDLWEWKMTWTGISLAAVALIVGGIIGGLSWIKPDTPSPSVTGAPIIIQMPSHEKPTSSGAELPAIPPPDNATKPSDEKAAE